MKNIISYKDFYEILDSTQNKKTLRGWQNLHEFDRTSPNKDFDARVYKRGNKIVICYAGSTSLNDYKNDGIILLSKIPSQYYEAERLYNIVKNKYPVVEQFTLMLIIEVMELMFAAIIELHRSFGNEL